MGRKKNKIKKNRAQKEARERAARAILVEQQKQTDNREQSGAKAATESANNDKPSWWQRFKSWMNEGKSFTDWCVAGFTLVLAIAAIDQFSVMGEQLTEMRRQIDISERPWISVEAAPENDLTFVNGRQAALGIKLSVKNVGKSIAKGIQIDAKLFPTAVDVPASPDAAKSQRQLCDHPERSPVGQFDLFPTDNPQEQVLGISAIPSAIDAQAVTSRENKSRTFVGFYVVGCISYHFSFGTEIHETRFAYHLIGSPIMSPDGKLLVLSNGMPAMTGFEVGVNVPKANLVIMRELFGYNDAN